MQSSEYTVEQIWDILVDCCIATEQELIPVTTICGYTIDTLNSVLYVRTGYRDIPQFFKDLG